MNFRYSGAEASTSTKNLKGFELISREQVLEFFSSNHLDMLNVHRILKTKLIIFGQENRKGELRNGNYKNTKSSHFYLKVYMAHCTLDGQYYAVKAINKSHLYHQKNGMVIFYNSNLQNKN